MTGPERACVNVLIGRIMHDWSTLRDGDLVAMVTRINGLAAMSVEAQRSNKQHA